MGIPRFTSFSGLPLVVEALRACEGQRAIEQGPPRRLCHRERGLSDAQMAESFCLLLAAGGECIDDFETLRDDVGLSDMVGYELPSPTRAKEYLYAFDQGMGLSAAQAAQQGLFGGKVACERGPIEALADGAWQFLQTKGDTARWWAEVEFIPSAPSRVKGRRPDRYVAIRLEPVQRELFADGSRRKHFAVVTNDWQRPAAELLRWHRQKAGTIEKLHDILKNDLGAGVMPCGRFGANAAWLRLNALCYNLLSIVRRHGLDEELQQARPKRLRLWVLCRAGQIVRHARSLLQLAWRVLQWERARGSPQPA